MFLCEPCDGLAISPGFHQPVAIGFSTGVKNQESSLENWWMYEQGKNITISYIKLLVGLSIFFGYIYNLTILPLQSWEELGYF